MCSFCLVTNRLSGIPHEPRRPPGQTQGPGLSRLQSRELRPCWSWSCEDSRLWSYLSSRPLIPSAWCLTELRLLGSRPIFFLQKATVSPWSPLVLGEVWFGRERGALTRLPCGEHVPFYQDQRGAGYPGTHTASLCSC